MITLEGSGQTKLVTRDEWKAQPARYVTRLIASFGTTLHWEGPGMGQFSHATCASYVRGIQDYHMKSTVLGGRGWSDIAYTCVVCPHGYVFEGRWLNHRTGANGTNIGNDSAYAICYLGGVGDPFTPEADRAIHDTTTHLRRHGRAGAKVNCHRDWKPTKCPGNIICAQVRTGIYETDARRPVTGTLTKEEFSPMDTVNMRIARGDGDGHWYATDGIYKKWIDGRDYAGILISNFAAQPQAGTGDPKRLNEIVPFTWPQQVIDQLIPIGKLPA